MPVGQQVPGRYDYDRDLQIAAIEADKTALGDAKAQQLAREKYGLSVAEAKQRIDDYYLNAGLPPGMMQRDDAPKLDPNKESKTAHE